MDWFCTQAYGDLFSGVVPKDTGLSPKLFRSVLTRTIIKSWVTLYIRKWIRTHPQRLDYPIIFFLTKKLQF